MNIISVSLRILPRLIALYILWDAISVVLQVARGGIGDPVAFAFSPSGITLFASAVTAIATVILGSITMYVLSIILLALGKGVIGHVVSPIPLIGLGIMLALDVVALGYREGQGRSISISSRSTLLSAIGLLAILGIAVGGAIYSGYAIAYLVVSLTSIPSQVKGAGVVLASLMANPFVKLIVVALASIYLYKFTSSIVDIVLIFAKPSRELSLSTLTSTHDIDVAIEYPLQTFFSLIVSAVVAPVIYEFVFKIFRLLTPMAFERIPYIDTISSIVIYLAVFIIISMYVKEFSVVGAKIRHIVLPASLALLTYATAVIISIEKGLTIAQAILNPGFPELNKSIYLYYLSFYTSFFYLVEVLAKLVGVAP